VFLKKKKNNYADVIKACICFASYIL
jgi:hypothetical protein